ncbi:polyprenol monophosphomannose synthase [Verrucomicrobiota bacterium]
MADSLVIIPTYNEIENIREITAAVLEKQPAFHILVVDDNSPDGTGRVADELAEKNERIHVIHRTEKDGLGRAYIAGFKWALERDYEFVFEMDADFSHSPDDLGRLREAAEDADLALGSRYINGIRIINWPLNRLILSKGASLYVRLITGMPITDPTGGFKCFRRNTLEALNLNQVQATGYSFQIEVNHKAWVNGFKITDVPIIFTDRHNGTSKMNKAIVFEAIWMVWKIFFACGCRRRPKQTV